jgi:hypothetical protein
VKITIIFFLSAMVSILVSLPIGQNSMTSGDRIGQEVMRCSSIAARDAIKYSDTRSAELSTLPANGLPADWRTIL